MSLLMDALRKAEQQKRMLAGEGQPASSGIELEPLPQQPPLEPPATETRTPLPQLDLTVGEPPVGTSPSPRTNESDKRSGNRLPELPTRLEDLDEQFIAHVAEQPRAPSPRPSVAAPPSEPTPAPAPVKRETTNPEASRESARKLFDAKLPAQKNNRSFAIAIGLISLVAAIGIGGYFWWQLQPKGGLVAGGAPRSPPVAPPVTPIAQAPAAQPDPIATPAVPPAPTFSTPAASTAAAATMPAADQDEDTATQAVAPPPKTAFAKPAPPQPAATEPAPIRLAAAPQKVSPLLDLAYQAFKRSEFDLARVNWQKVLASDPRNADALHGLAAVAQQQQDPNEAVEFYLRALEADPKDAFALSGLVSLRASANAQHTESRLKTLLAEQPGSPYLNFALGNLYARSERWAEAQQAFFKAHSSDPENPDYLFNLAVSLDQLHQSRLAIQYYNRAIAAATQQPASFDTAEISARLQILQSDSQR